MPGELVWRKDDFPLQRRSNGAIMVPIRLPASRQQVPVTLERTRTMRGVLPAEGRRDRLPWLCGA